MIDLRIMKFDDVSNIYHEIQLEARRRQGVWADLLTEIIKDL